MFQRVLKYIENWILGSYLLLVFLASLHWSFDTEQYKKEGILWSDAEGYYMYLPAVFIYDGFVEVPIRTKAQFTHYEGTNKYLTKYTAGVALLQAPFFLAGHWMAQNQGAATDGYSNYYIHSIMIAAICYTFLGFVFLRLFLRRYFSEWVIFITLISLYFGTNLYYYTVRAPGMSHAYSFALFAWIVYLTPLVYERAKTFHFGLLGLLLGLTVLIRPTNLVLVLFVFFFNIDSWKALGERFLFFLQKHLFATGLLIVAGILPFLPQFYYWYYLSGNILLYSYGDEGFSNWNNPKIKEVLFDVKSGWIRYSPLVVLPILGLLADLQYNKYQSRVILAILLIVLYAFASWWCWWFGGAFGHRSFVEFYVLLAIPFAYLTQLIGKQRFLLFKVLYMGLLVLSIYYSQGLTERYVGPHYTKQTLEQALEELF